MVDIIFLKIEVWKLSRRGDINNKKFSSVSVYNNIIYLL